MPSLLAIFSTVLLLNNAVRAQLWTLVDAYIGRDFLSTWEWETEDDPTHGRVNYIGLDASVAANLTYGASSSSHPVIPWLTHNVNSEREQICHACRRDARCG